MRKNLTISLSPQDWSLVRDSAQALGETYSGLFHHLIRQALSPGESDARAVRKYRPLFRSHAAQSAERARALARATFRPR